MVFIRKNKGCVELQNEDMECVRVFDDADVKKRDGEYVIHGIGCEFDVLCTVPTTAAGTLNV